MRPKGIFFTGWGRRGGHKRQEPGFLTQGFGKVSGLFRVSWCRKSLRGRSQVCLQRETRISFSFHSQDHPSPPPLAGTFQHSCSLDCIEEDGLQEQNTPNLSRAVLRRCVSHSRFMSSCSLCLALESAFPQNLHSYMCFHCCCSGGRGMGNCAWLIKVHATFSDISLATVGHMA